MSNNKGFTLIEFLVALVIIGFIVAVLVGVFANPLKQATMDAKTSQVWDGLRQWNEAAASSYLAGSCDKSDDTASCLANINLLVSNGTLTSLPTIPAGIAGSGSYGQITWSTVPPTVPGGCGAGNSGAARYPHAILANVSAEFCKAYNEKAGYGSIIIPNCSTANCSASGSTSPLEYPAGFGPTLCLAGSSEFENNIVFNAGMEYSYGCNVDGPADLLGIGDSAVTAGSGGGGGACVDSAPILYAKSCPDPTGRAACDSGNYYSNPAATTCNTGNCYYPSDYILYENADCSGDIWDTASNVWYGYIGLDAFCADGGTGVGECDCRRCPAGTTWNGSICACP